MPKINSYSTQEELLDAIRKLQKQYCCVSGSGSSTVELGLVCSNEVDDIIVADNVATVVIPYDFTLTELIFGVSSAPTGDDIIIEVNLDGTPILSTNVHIDAGSISSIGSGTPYVISTSAMTAGSLLSIDILQVGSINAGVALKGFLFGTKV